ncbi:hypothetical protein CC79DRAFT_146983 [Sarocladium strictum]
MRRQTHNKSRAGCKQCKQRHQKCDERHPSCTSCSNTQRVCSFRWLSASKPLTGSQEVYEGAKSNAPTNVLHCMQSATTIPTWDFGFSGTVALSGVDPAHLYELSQFELVHHFEHHYADAASLGSSFGKTFFRVVLHRAFKNPYLMNQIIALSAAHKTTRYPPESEQRLRYRTDALRFQGRALSALGDMRSQLLTGDCLSVFLFSSLIGQHILFDTFASRQNFPAILDSLVQCFSLHAGTRALVNQSWRIIQSQFEVESGRPYPIKPREEEVGNAVPLGPFLKLRELIRQEGHDFETTSVFMETISVLQRYFRKQQLHPEDPFARAEAVHECTIDIPMQYIRALQRQQPQAIVLLAWYGVLLHNAQDYWSFGDAGAYLIRATTMYLGDYWAPLIEWPQQVLVRRFSHEI